MFNVYDPLFQIDKLGTVSDTVEMNDVTMIGNAMGYKDISNKLTYAEYVQLDNLYNNDCSIVIPIVYETVGTTGKLENTLTDYNQSYLVITSKSSDIAKNTGDSVTAKYSCTDDSGSAITGDGADTILSGLKQNRMVNFRFYRNSKDTHPIIYDAIQPVFYGYQTEVTTEGSERVAETQICLDQINILLKQQIMQVSTVKIYPFCPTEIDKYMVASENITQIGTSTTAGVSSISGLNNSITDSKCCHIKGSFYILSNMADAPTA